MRDKLIELIQTAVDGCTRHWAGVIADHLIANNVTAPPVKIGQTIYVIRRPTNHPAWISECTVAHMSVHYFADGRTTVLEGYNFFVKESDIGKTVFLTREEAERALREERTPDPRPEWQRRMMRTFGGDADA